MSSLCKNFLTPPSATLIGPHKERGSRGYLDLNIKTRLMCICALYMVVICIVMLYAMSITTSLSLSQVDSLSPAHSDYKCDHVTKTRLKCLS